LTRFRRIFLASSMTAGKILKTMNRFKNTYNSISRLGCSSVVNQDVTNRSKRSSIDSTICLATSRLIQRRLNASS